MCDSQNNFFCREEKTPHIRLATQYVQTYSNVCVCVRHNVRRLACKYFIRKTWTPKGIVCLTIYSILIRIEFALVHSSVVRMKYLHADRSQTILTIFNAKPIQDCTAFFSHFVLTKTHAASYCAKLSICDFPLIFILFSSSNDSTEIRWKFFNPIGHPCNAMQFSVIYTLCEWRRDETHCSAQWEKNIQREL